MELEEQRLSITDYLRPLYQCTCCSKSIRGPLPFGIDASPYGPRYEPLLSPYQGATICQNERFVLLFRISITCLYRVERSAKLRLEQLNLFNPFVMTLSEQFSSKTRRCMLMKPMEARKETSLYLASSDENNTTYIRWIENEAKRQEIGY